MRKYYAQIDDNKDCFSVLETDRVIDDPHMIEIDQFDADYIGMKFPGAVLPPAKTPAEKAAEVQARKDERLSRGWQVKGA